MRVQLRPDTSGAALLAAALNLPLALPAGAESPPEQGTLSVKYLDYRDRQPAADRIRVQARALDLLTPVAGDWSLGATLVHDTISGASPAYHAAALSKVQDLRRAADVELVRYFLAGSVTVGAAVSNESDYRSRSLSLQGSRTSEDKNTRWTAGWSVSNDAINPVNHVVADAGRHSASALLSLTQVMGMDDIVQLSLGRVQGRGYFSDPYKAFDERPAARRNLTLLLRWNHHLAEAAATLRSSYRYYDDSWGVRAHTLSLELVRPLPGGWTLTPSLRLYTQGAARFYVDADPSSPFVPNRPAGWRHFSADQRLSAFGAATVGLLVARQLTPDWQVDVKVERYRQRSAWRPFGQGSPGLPAFDANSFIAGLSRQF